MPLWKDVVHMDRNQIQEQRHFQFSFFLIITSMCLILRLSILNGKENISIQSYYYVLMLCEYLRFTRHTPCTLLHKLIFFRTPLVVKLMCGVMCQFTFLYFISSVSILQIILLVWSNFLSKSLPPESTKY